jgi:hypothetical protein
MTTTQADADVEVVATAEPRDPPAALLLAAFTIVAFGLTFPNVTRFRTFVPGDSGDALLNLWIMRSVQAGMPDGWHALWNRPIFSPAPDTLAYSDTLFPVALLHWPLRMMFGDAAAMNVLSIGAAVLSSWCTYLLTRRIVRHWGAAFVAAFAFTYASVRLIHQGHFQLVVGSALVPLAVLLLLRLLDAPSTRRAVAFGLALAVLTLTASYFGAMMAVVSVVVAGGWLLTLPRGSRAAPLRSLAIAAGLAALLVAPAALQYVRLQQHSEFRRGFSPGTAARFGDFLATGPDNYLLTHLPVISSATSGNRTIENRLFPGVVALGFGIAGVVVLVRQIRRRGMRSGPTRDLVLIIAAGVVCLVLSFGDWFRVGDQRVFLPFAVFRHAVPGFAGIRAVARLALFTQLALVLCAAVGLDALLARAGRVARVLLTLGLATVVCLEAAMSLWFVRVPTEADDGGVSAALRARPAGIVAELPVGSALRGLVWPFGEAPRQLVALRDGRPRVNGYSGFQPAGFDAEAATLNEFPSPAALAEMRRLGVRYVVLRTQLVGPVMPEGVTPVIGADGAARFSDRRAREMIARIPPGVARAVVPLPGGYLIELNE